MPYCDGFVPATPQDADPHAPPGEAPSGFPEWFVNRRTQQVMIVASAGTQLAAHLHRVARQWDAREQRQMSMACNGSMWLSEDSRASVEEHLRQAFLYEVSAADRRLCDTPTLAWFREPPAARYAVSFEAIDFTGYRRVEPGDVVADDDRLIARVSASTLPA